MADDLGTILRTHRLAHGLTQESLAERAGLSVQAIGALERGERRHPQRATLDRLSSAMTLSTEERLQLTDAARRQPAPRPQISSPVSSPVSSPAVRPRSLPPGPPHLVGRDAELAELVGVLTATDAMPVGVVTGMGGVGKTALAIEVAHRVAPAYPDGQIYLDLQGRGSDQAVRDAMLQVCRALGYEAPDVAADLRDATARYRTCLAAGARILLVLDNVGARGSVASLLPGATGIGVLITGRQSMPLLPADRHLRLDVLSEHDSLQLLAQASGPSRHGDEVEACREVVRLCGRLPLAIRLAGARLATRTSWPVGHLVDRLADKCRRLDELEYDDAGVRACFAVSLDELDAGDREAVALLGLLGIPDISVAVAARLFDRVEIDADRTLERLTDASLLEAAAPGRYRMHDLLVAQCAEIAAAALSDSDRRAAYGRVTDRLAVTAWRGLALRTPNGQRARWSDPAVMSGAEDLESSCDAFDWLDDHHALLNVVVASNHVPPESLVRLAVGLFSYFGARGRAADWINVCRAALATLTQEDSFERGFLQKDLGMALSHRVIGPSCPRRQEASDSFFESLAIFKRLGDDALTAMCLVNLTYALESIGDLDLLFGRAREGVQLSHDIGDLSLEAAARTNLGNLCARSGDGATALLHYRAALGLFETVDSGIGIAAVLLRIAKVHAKDGRNARAVVALRRSHDLAHDLGDQVLKMGCVEWLGRVALATGDVDAALGHLTDALAIARRIGDRERSAMLQELVDSVTAPPAAARGHHLRLT